MNTIASFFRDNLAWIISLATILIGGFGYVYKHIRALQLGVQALLRAQMVDMYNHYKQRKVAPLYARESFEVLWENYRTLGGNGFVTDIHAHFMALPTHEEKGKADDGHEGNTTNNTNDH